MVTYDRRAVTSDDARPLWMDRNVADQCGVSLSAVRRWRLERRGPPHVKLGSCVRYRPEDVIAWIEQNVAGGASDGVRS